MRLIIYRSFIRSISEYVIAPAYLWILRSPQTRSQLFKTIIDVYRKGIQFIFQPFQYSPVLFYISNIEPPELRLQYLHASLVRSLSHMSPDNPLLLCRPFYCISASSHFILSECFKSPIYSKYLQLKSQTNYATLRWKTFMSWEFNSSLISYPASSILLSYVRPSVPLRQLSVSLFNLSIPDFLSVVSWRLNRYQPSKRLCTCGVRFQRTHIDCILSDTISYCNILDSPAFFIASKSCPNRLTVLDHLLNLNSLDNFLLLLRLVGTLI